MKRGWLLWLILVAFFGFSGVANATPLEIIGTATYLGINYNLIYEEDNNGQGLIWLDYTSVGKWQSQMDWAAGLNGVGVLDYNLNPWKNVSWEGDWRLPSAGVNPQKDFNQTTSEMGHLYYVSFGITAGWPLGDPDPFENLKADKYWFGTEYSPYPIIAWQFDFFDGFQYIAGKTVDRYALAVRPGDVSPVPEPTTMLLLGSGLIGLAGYRRKKFF